MVVHPKQQVQAGRTEIWICLHPVLQPPPSSSRSPSIPSSVRTPPFIGRRRVPLALSWTRSLPGGPKLSRRRHGEASEESQPAV